MLNRSCQTSRHPLSDRGADLYETPAVAIEALLRVEQLPHRIWEPACGPGAIVRVLRAAGYLVHASDLLDYGCPGSEAGVDFLLERQAPSGVECVVTNPPFRLAEHFAAHALQLVPHVIMLLRLGFLESSRRTEILEQRGLARVHIFKKRLPMMHRAGWQGRRATSAIPFAWFVWQRGYAGHAELRRVSWEPPA